MADNFCETKQMPNEVLPANTMMTEIGYNDCANAMLSMWMDNIVTDGEYNRIIDKLNKHYGKVEES